MAAAHRETTTPVWIAVNATTLTPGVPATRQADDLLELWVYTRLITATMSTPSGWTLDSDFPKTSGTASGGRVWRFLRKATATAADDPGALTVTGPATGTTGDIVGAHMSAYSGVDVSDVANHSYRDASATVTDASITTTISYPSITTAGVNALHVLLGFKVVDATGTFAQSTNYTERADSFTTTRTGGGIDKQDRSIAAAGATGAVTSAITTATGAGRSLAISVSLKSPIARSGTATASAKATTTATGAKGAQSAGTGSLRVTTVGVGAKGGQGTASSSARGVATATGAKGGQSAATASAKLQATAFGFGPITASGSASTSAGARAVATGAKGGQTAASATTAVRAAATGVKGGQDAAKATSATRTTATGAKGAQSAATGSARSQATATGVKGGQGAAASAARPQTTATGARGASGVATATGATRATATGQKAAVRASRIGLNHGPPNRVVHTEEFSGSSVSNVWDDANTFGEFVVAGGVLTPGWNLGDDGELSWFLPDGLDGRAVSVENVSEISNGDEFTAVYLGVRSKLPETSDFFYLSVQLQGDGNLRIFSNRGYEDLAITMPSDTTIAYNHATMRYWRIRSEGDAFISETSPDRLVWTARQTVILDGFHEPGREVRAFLGYVDAGGPEGDGAFDNFRLESNGAPTTTATGAKGGQSAASASVLATVVASGLKAVSSAAAASARVTVTATGTVGTPDPSGSASATARPSATASGFKGGVGSAQSGASAIAAATGSKSVSGPASVSARGTATATGASGRTSAAVVSSTAPRVTGSGAASRAGSASISAGVTVTATIGGVSGSATVSARATVTSSGRKTQTVPGGRRVHVSDRGQVRVVPRGLPTVERGRVD